jgi:hypothetical protein
MKKILLPLGLITLVMTGCSSTDIKMSMGNMRLIQSSAAPQDVMNFATKACQSDFYLGASFISKASNEYRFKCVRTEENEILTPIPSTSITPNTK